MTDIYTFDSYKNFVRKWVEHLPKRGYGQFRKMADHLGVGTVLVSQIFNGERHLNEEQAVDLSQYMNLLEGETKYFMALVRHSRAGTHRLKDHIATEIKQLKQDAKELKGRIKSEADLSKDQQAIFYSDWFYSAIRLAADIPERRDVASISEFLDLPAEKVKMAVEFLLQTGLCEMANGQLCMGPKIVYLPADSPHVLSRQRSWRIRGFHQMESVRPENLFFTCPIVCSTKTAEEVRSKILKFVEHVLGEVKESESEELVCLNIDWFRV